MKQKGKRGGKKNREGFWLVACLPRHCSGFLQTCNQIWDGLETYRHGVLSKTEWCSLKKRRRRNTHTHSPCCAELWLWKEMSHKKQFPCTMKNVPITNTVFMSLNLFVLSYCSRVVSFSGNPASIMCDGTHMSLIRGQHLLLLVFETTPALQHNWALKGILWGCCSLCMSAWISWCLACP